MNFPVFLGGFYGVYESCGNKCLYLLVDLYWFYFWALIGTKYIRAINSQRSFGNCICGSRISLGRTRCYFVFLLTKAQGCAWAREKRTSSSEPTCWTAHCEPAWWVVWELGAKNSRLPAYTVFFKVLILEFLCFQPTAKALLLLRWGVFLLLEIPIFVQ